ncbi:MAG: class I SAM-dependent methyltransferase family protein [bacterium]|nr:class I SAM-dependent methyltransferase family protein [bacterium]
MTTAQKSTVQANLSTSSLYEYKRRGILRLIRIGVIVSLNLLPGKITQKLFLLLSKSDSDPSIVFTNVGTWRALEVMYTLKKRRDEGLVNKVDIFWQGLLDNTRSIRNRLLLVKEELTTLINAGGLNGTPVRVLSIGSGSARPVLEAIASLKGTPGTELLLVDQDESALQFSELLATELQVNHTKRKTGNFLRIARDCASFHPQIIEMVGLLDYLDDDHCVFILKQVLKTLIPGGHLVTGNIVPNLESVFVTSGINWPMVYRTPEELQDVLVLAGFPPEGIRTTKEPLGIHTIAVCTV